MLFYITALSYSFLDIIISSNNITHLLFQSSVFQSKLRNDVVDMEYIYVGDWMTASPFLSIVVNSSCQGLPKSSVFHRGKVGESMKHKGEWKPNKQDLFDLFSVRWVLVVFDVFSYINSFLPKPNVFYAGQKLMWWVEKKAEFFCFFIKMLC